jgi:arylsulfatase A-like enzyme
VEVLNPKQHFFKRCLRAPLSWLSKKLHADKTANVPVDVPDVLVAAHKRLETPHKTVPTVKPLTMTNSTGFSSGVPPSSPSNGDVRAHKKLMFYVLILIGGLGSLGMLYLVHDSTAAGIQQNLQWLDHFDLPQETKKRLKEGLEALTGVGGSDDDVDSARQDEPQQQSIRHKSSISITGSSPKDFINASKYLSHTQSDRQKSFTSSTTASSPKEFIDASKYLSPETSATRSNAGGLRKPSVTRVSLPQQDIIKVDKMPRPDDTKEEDDRLNVMLFYADDWTMKVLGKFDPVVKTPNIDALADEGMIFSNNCVTTSVCWISRASLVTGAYYARHLQNFPSASELYTTNLWNQTLFPRMKQAGYFTGLMGKWHAPGPSKEMGEAFSMRRFYYGKHWYGDEYCTDMNEKHAVDFLKVRPTNKPFFLKVSFFATHARDGHYPSFEPKNETRNNIYPNSNYIEPPKTATEEHFKQLPSFFERSEARTRWKKRFEPDYFQDNVKDLYSMATDVDSAIGRIVEELKSQGIYNKTMIIFTTDNGNLQGEHGLTEKWYPFEESLRVPLVIYDPRMPHDVRGTINHDWTLNIDLAPTILGAANLEQSSFMQGRDISQLYLNRKKDTSPAWRKDFFYEFNMGNPINASDHPWKNWLDASFALVNNEWKYVYWPQQDYEQLYHRSVDPYDEWDLLHKIETASNVDFRAIQTTDQIYKDMKERYAFLKERAQSGYRI